jgi:hypothetical protein
MSESNDNRNRHMEVPQPEGRIAQGVRWAATGNAVGRTDFLRIPTSAEIDAEIEAEVKETLRRNGQLNGEEGGREPSFHTGLAITLAAASIPLSAMLFLAWLALK